MTNYRTGTIYKIEGEAGFVLQVICQALLEFDFAGIIIITFFCLIHSKAKLETIMLVLIGFSFFLDFLKRYDTVPINKDRRV